MLWHYQNIARTLVLMIVFGTQCNLLIVLRGWLKFCGSSVFPFSQGKTSTPEKSESTEYAWSTSGKQLVQALKFTISLLRCYPADENLIFCSDLSSTVYSTQCNLYRTTKNAHSCHLSSGHLQVQSQQGKHKKTV